MKPKSKPDTALAVKLLALSHDDRVKLLKGLVLRRLDAGRPLDRAQFDLAMSSDFDEIAARVDWFSVKELIDLEPDIFFKSLLVTQIVQERTAPQVQQGNSLREKTMLPGHRDLVLVERGPMAADFLANLGDELTDLIDSMPMSVRGLIDNLKSHPDESKTITMTVEEFEAAHGKGSGKEVIVEHNDDDPRNKQRPF